MNVSNFFHTRVHVVDRGCRLFAIHSNVFSDRTVRGSLKAASFFLQQTWKVGLKFFFFSQFGVLQNVFALTRIR